MDSSAGCHTNKAPNASSSKAFIDFRSSNNMEVKIISKETIKPSSPTPHHLRTHNLSLLDQIEIGESIYIPVILFYSSAAKDSVSKSNILKESLSKTLTHFYPFAGRLKDGFSIDCNDDGVIYTEAQVAIDMSVFLNGTPDIDLLLKLLPHDDLERLPEPTGDQVLVAIQVSFFACGGMAICVCVDHVVADGAATATLIKTWASMAFADDYIDVHDVIFDCRSIFRSRDLLGFIEDENQVPEPQGKEIVTKRFLFNGSKITALKNEIGNGSISSSYGPSRFEAVSALIWSAMLSTTSKDDETFTRVTISMNLRTRTNPPLPQQCIGNVYLVKEVEPLLEKTMNLSILAGKIHETITKVDDEYVKKLGEAAAGTAYINFLTNKVKNNMFLFVSWCRFPFYESDFGWGKPIWVATALRINRAVTFLDSSNGEGIEAWITLSHEEMAKFEQDPGILAYSFSS